VSSASNASELFQISCARKKLAGIACESGSIKRVLSPQPITLHPQNLSADIKTGKRRKNDA
jgi:hypothetical protein